MAYYFLLSNVPDVSGLSGSDDIESGSQEEITSSEGGEGSDDLQSYPIFVSDSFRDSGNVSDMDLQTLESNQEYIIQQIDNLNNNVCVIQHDNSITVGLLFSITVILAIQIVFKLLYKVLGLGQM